MDCTYIFVYVIVHRKAAARVPAIIYTNLLVSESLHVHTHSSVYVILCCVGIDAVGNLTGNPFAECLISHDQLPP